MASYTFLCELCGYEFETDLVDDTVECPKCGHVMQVDEDLGFIVGKLRRW